MNMFDKILKYKDVLDEVAIFLTLLVEKKKRTLKFKIKNKEKKLEELTDKELDSLLNTYTQKIINALLEAINNEQNSNKS